MSSNRDDFSAPVIRKLAERVNYDCSCPDCRKPTLGPSPSDPSKSINLGKAAHITAAAPGGKRYDPTLTSAQRKSIQNGIWLCTLHADLIDKDEQAYPVKLLHKWKADAENRAAISAFTTAQLRPEAKVIFELSEEDRAFLHSLALPPEETTETIVQRLVTAARNDIQAFVNEKGQLAHAIPLDLTLLGNSGETPTSLTGVARGIAVSDAVTFVSPPGTGKTTTLVQLAETIISGGDRVAAYIPLGEWEGSRSGWFETLIRRNAFRSFKPEHFMRLAYEDRLVVVLDGWNELSPEASAHAHKQLRSLLRDFPQLGVVIGTRQQAQPIDGPIVRVEPLNEEQQLELARRLRGPEGARLIDQAWRTPGVRDLVAIPLYLTALLLGVPDDILPDTQDAILSSFVRQHESAPEKAVLLRSKLLGLHRNLLSDLASTANSSRTTALTEEQARTSITKAVTRLQASHQLTAPLQPAMVLDTLVDSHLLTRSSASSSIGFQHQQFQEWYASFRVERLVLDAAQGDEGARKTLRDEVLNWLSWEESILFACERLSRKDHEGEVAVAHAIIDTLGIDPMLAAEMIHRSAPEVWTRVRDQVMAFADRWHQPGNVDRAVRFMIMTGKPDFASQVWPFLENPDSQVYLHVLRLAARFRPSVLGLGAAQRMAALPADQRGSVVAEIASRSGYDGIELAAGIAEADSEFQVVVEVLEALHFRRATRHVTDILSKAGDAIWQEVAKRGSFRDLDDKAQWARIASIRRAAIESEVDPLKQAQLLLYSNIDGVNAEERLYQILTSEALLSANDKGRSLIFEVHNRFPAVALSALMNRLQHGGDVPNGVEDILDNAPAVDSGPIAEAALIPGRSKPMSRMTDRVIGPITVGRLIDALVALGARIKGQPYRKAANDEYFGYRDAITDSRQTSFLPAFMQRANTKDVHVITSLAELLHLHGRHIDHPPMAVSDGDRQRLVEILLRWSKTLLTAANATRHHIVGVVQAMQRVPTLEFVPIIDKMLQRDVAETSREMEESRKAHRPGVHMSYGKQYRATFSAIGSDQVLALMKAYLPDLRFGVEAALVLLDMWNRDHPSEDERRFHRWPDYSYVKALHDRVGKDSPISGESAEAIFAVARKYGTSGNTRDEQRQALRLASIAMRMPFGVNRPEIDELFKLPLRYAAKQDLFVIAAMSGVVLSVHRLSEAVRELLHEAKTEHWRLDENRSELITWIELFAFSDHPLAVLENIDLLPPDHRKPYRLRRLLQTLGSSPHPDALNVLKALAQRDPTMTEDDDWIEALIRLATVDAARTMLDGLCNGKLSGRHRYSGYGFSRQLSAVARDQPAFRSELFARYADASTCKAADILEAALLELAEPDALVAVVHRMASRGKAYDNRLSMAIRELAIGRKPSAHWVGAMELFSVELTAFRKELLAMMTDEGSLAELARKCLGEIDELRDEYGRIDDEPRHPDIASGKAWPVG